MLKSGKAIDFGDLGEITNLGFGGVARTDMINCVDFGGITLENQHEYSG